MTIWAGIVFRRIFGTLAVVFGVAILGWFIYNQLHPTDEFKRNFHSVFQLGLPIVFLIVGWRWLKYEGPGIEETSGYLQCKELTESVVKAKETLPRFITEVEKNVDNAYIKFPLHTAGGGIEHIWAYVHSFRDGSFNVSLANAPKDPNESAEGRRDVNQEEVEDWQIMLKDGKLRGAYSTIALFLHRRNSGQKLSPKMKKQRALLLDFPGYN